VLAALLSTAAAGIESARRHRSAREQAELDPLTRLPNRRKLEADLDAEWQRSTRYQRPLALVMLDLDHFKSLNDTYGHLVGDMVLREAATALGASLRDSDTAYRYGGEEFTVVLRETTLEEALRAAERMRAAVAAVNVPGYPVTVTASIGAAAASNTMPDQSALVAAADGALYRAKSGGRNRVEHAPGASAGDLGSRLEPVP
jgi:diguanylate cyclase (GGDEF)-like protein